MAEQAWRCYKRKDLNGKPGTVFNPTTKDCPVFHVGVAYATDAYHGKHSALTASMLTYYQAMRWTGKSYTHDPTQDVTLVKRPGQAGYRSLTAKMRERLLRGDVRRAVLVTNANGDELDVMSTRERDLYQKELVQRARAEADRARKKRLRNATKRKSEKRKKSVPRSSWLSESLKFPDDDDDADEDPEAGGKFISPGVLIIPDL